MMMTAAREEDGLTMDEQLIAFLDKWEAVRAGQIKKYQLAADYYRDRPHMGICYEAAMRSLRHYEHEAAMLAELRARAVSPALTAALGGAA